MTRLDITYSANGFVPRTAAANEWLAKAFAAIDGDLSADQVETIAAMARASGFTVGQH